MKSIPTAGRQAERQTESAIVKIRAELEPAFAGHIREAAGRSMLHPGVFAVLACGAASGGKGVPHSVYNFAAGIEMLHIASQMQNDILELGAKGAEDRQMFSKILARLSCASRGMGAISLANAGNGKSSAAILGIISGFCDSERDSLNARTLVLDCIRKGKMPNLTYVGYAEKVYPRVVLHAILIGDALGGGKREKTLAAPGGALSTAYGIWDNAARLSKYFRGEVLDGAVLELIPSLLVGFDAGGKLLPAMKAALEKHSGIPDSLVNPDVLYAMDGWADRYYELGTVRLARIYGKHSGHIIEYAEKTRKAFMEAVWT